MLLAGRRAGESVAGAEVLTKDDDKLHILHPRQRNHNGSVN